MTRKKEMLTVTIPSFTIQLDLFQLRESIENDVFESIGDHIGSSILYDEVGKIVNEEINEALKDETKVRKLVAKRIKDKIQGCM